MATELESLKRDMFVENGLAKDKEAVLKPLQAEMKKLRDQPFLTKDESYEFGLMFNEEKALIKEINQHYENARKAELKIEFASNPPPSGQSREEQVLSQMRSDKDRSKGGPER